jgi:hypothetical protein
LQIAAISVERQNTCRSERSHRGSLWWISLIVPLTIMKWWWDEIQALTLPNYIDIKRVQLCNQTAVGSCWCMLILFEPAGTLRLNFRTGSSYENSFNSSK